MKTIKRVALSLLVIVCMLFAFSFATSINVHAENEHSHHYNLDGLCECGQCEGQHNGWTLYDSVKPSSGFEIELSTGKYYLNSDVILDKNCYIKITGNVTFCLNGYVLSGRVESDSSLISVSEGSTLNITDCNSTLPSASKVEHHFSENPDGLWVWDQNNVATAHIVEGGIITGGNATTDGGAIEILGGYRNPATLNIYSGSIVGNKSEVNGGAIYCFSSNINIYGGLIAGNCSGTNGGAVSIVSFNSNFKSTLSMYGGTITNNCALINGGAISTDSGTTAKYTTVNLYGGTIANNIANKEASKNGIGGGVVFYCTTYVGGTINITGNKINLNDGKSTYAIENNLFIPSGKTISFKTGYLPSDGMNVGITTETKPQKNEVGDSTNVPFASKYSESFKKYFNPDDSDYKVIVTDAYILNIGYPVHKHNGISFQVELNADLLNSSEGKLAGELLTNTYYLENDLIISSPIKIKTGQTVKICLSNHGIIGNYENCIFNVEASATLELYDCEQGKSYFIDSDQNGSYDTKVVSQEQTSIEITGGYITGGKSTGDSGSCINVNGGTFNMYGGTLIGNEQINSDSLGGGALNITNGGTAIINGGAFVGNISENGGAINISDDENSLNVSALVISNCDINNNIAKNGGAIYSSSNSDLLIKGGEYKYNKALVNGGAIYNELSTRLFVDNGIFNDNVAEGKGGAIYAIGEASFFGGNINNNKAGVGNGVYITPDVTTQGATKTVTIGGTVKIENNIVNEVQSNLYLENDVNYIELQRSSLENGANVGVTSKLDPTDGTVILCRSANQIGTDYIFSDDDEFSFVDKIISGVHTLKLLAPLKVTYHSDLHNNGYVPVDNNKYFEEDVVTIKGNTGNLVRKGYKFLGWNTVATATEALDSTLVISDNVDLYAIWEEKLELTFDTSKQSYPYDNCIRKFGIDHELSNSFLIMYVIDGIDNINGVMNVGTYDVKISRPEDSNYKEVDITIKGGIEVTRKEIVPIIQDLPNKTFTRSEIVLATEEIKVLDNVTKLTYGTDYEVSYSNNVDAGSATLTITCIGNYTGTNSKNFTIVSKEITPTIGGVELAVFDVNGATPGVSLHDNGFPLVAGTDYTIEYTNNKAVGTGHLVVTCCGNYSGTAETDFDIVKKSFEPTVDDIEDQVYAKEEICPTLNVRDGEYLMVEGTDYDVEYSDNVIAGTASAVITLKGNYEGSKTVQFTIKKKELTVNWSNLSFVYDGFAHKPTAELVGVFEGDVVTIEVSGEQTKAGTEYVATATFTEEPYNYMFANNTTPTTEFAITQAETVVSDLEIEGWIYGQLPKDPTANSNFGTILFAYSADLDGEYVEEVPENAGTYYVKAYVEETDEWSYDEEVVEFTIAKYLVSTTFCVDNFTYNGTSQSDKLSATYKNVKAQDIALVVKEIKLYPDGEYDDFKNAGQWYVSFTFNTDEELNNYTFANNSDYNFKVYVMKKATYNMDNAEWNYGEAFTYNGEAKKVEVTGLPEGVTVKEYTDNEKTNAGTYTAKVTFDYDTDNYNEVTLDDCEWTINKATYDVTKVSWDYEESFVYDGTVKTILLKDLPNGVTVEYDNNTGINAGTYTAEITKYIYDEDNYNAPDTIDSCEWVIDKATFNMDDVDWNYNDDLVYDGTEKKVNVIGLPNGLTVNCSNNSAIEAGPYLAKVSKYNYDAANYNEPSAIEDCEWEIKKADYDMSNVDWNYTEAFTYDGNEKKVELVNIPEGITYSYQYNKATIAGTYTAEAFVIDYDQVNYNEPRQIDSCEWVINKATYDMSNVKWVYENAFTYDKQAHKVEVNGLPEGVTVKTYENNEKTNAGNYVAKVVEFNYDTTNYNAPVFTTTLDWAINKATYDMSSAKWNYTTPFIYDGSLKTVEVVDLPEGVTVSSYSGNTGTLASNAYVASVVLDYDTQNYESISINDLNWVINKATYDMSSVKWVYENAFTYNGETHKVEVNGLPEGVTVKTYENNEKTNAGNYVAKVVEFNFDTTNYNAPVFTTTLDWAINKATYDMSGVKWNYTTPFTYNGEAHKVEVNALPEGVTVKTYENNEKTNAGNYVAKVVEFNYDTTNYNAPVFTTTLDWAINKATYDMSGAKWSYTTPFIYDGTTKKVEAIDLPTGVTVKTYANNEMSNAGSYEASVVEFNYDATNYIAPKMSNCSWVIALAEYDMSNVKWNYTEAFVYDGTEKNVELTGLPEGVTATYTNNTNIKVGKYEASVVLTYDAENYEPVTFETLNWEIVKANYELNVKFDSLTIPEDQTSHMIKVVGNLPSGVSVEYYCNNELFNGAKEAGTYEITAKFVGDYDNYNEIDDMNATLVIQATEIVVPIAPGKDKPDVMIETENGFPADVVIEFSNSVDDTEEKHTSTFDYEGNKDKETKLKFDEEVSFVFELKLMREINGQMVPIQPTDLEGVNSIKVKILIPEDVDINGLTRIIHVHSDDDLSVIEFDASKVDENRYYEIEINKLSEFAFIHKKDCSAHWGLLIILIIYLAALVVWVFVRKNYKFDVPSIAVTISYGIAWFIFVFSACCFKCIIFAVIDFIVLIAAVVLLGTSGAEKICGFLFSGSDGNVENAKNVEKESVSNKESFKRFNEHLASTNDKSSSYEEKKLDEMYAKLIRDAVQPNNYNGKDKVEVVGVCFANGKRIYKYSPNGNKISVGDKVKVEGQNGSKLGRIIHSNYYVKPSEVGEVKNIISVLK